MERARLTWKSGEIRKSCSEEASYADEKVAQLKSTRELLSFTNGNIQSSVDSSKLQNQAQGKQRAVQMSEDVRKRTQENLSAKTRGRR